MTSDERILVLVVDTDEEFLGETKALLATQRVVTTRDLVEATEIASGGRVDAIVLGPAFASELAIDQARGLLDADTTAEAYLVVESAGSRLFRAALKNGLRDVFELPLTQDDAFEVAEGIARLSDSAPEVDVVVEPAPEMVPADSADELPLVVDATPDSTMEIPPALSHEPTAEAAVAAAEVTFAPAEPRPAEESPGIPPIEPATIVVAPAVPDSSVRPPYAAPVIPAEPGAPSAREADPYSQAEEWGPPAAAARAVEAENPPPDHPEPEDVRRDWRPPIPEVPHADAPYAPTVGDDVIDAIMPPPPPLPPPTPAEYQAPLPAAAVPRGPGKVIAVTAGKGGSGKTVVATNLAVAIGMRGDPERVAIVDADLQFGDVALLLQIDPSRTLDDVVGEVDSMSDERLDAALLRHDTGLRVLPAPLLPVRSGEISAKAVVEVVDRLRSMFDTIIIDTGSVFDDGLITLLEHADKVVTVVDMDLPSVKNAKVALDGLRGVGFDMTKIRMVVNRSNSRARLDMVELERSLGLRVGGTVPSDRLIPQSVNEGIPVVTLSPRSKAARAFHALAESLDPTATRERLAGR